MSDASSRPLIAIPAYSLKKGRVTHWSDGGYAVPANYVDAVHRAGGRAVLLTPGDPAPPGEQLAAFDGLLLVGGGDIDPFLYDTEPHDSLYGMDRKRDLSELGLAKEAAAAQMPTLAICRGMQVANVAFGGSLIQHLPDLGLTDHGQPADDDGYALHEVDVSADSEIARICGTTHLEVSSAHHQAIDIPAEGFRTTAETDDGVVEAMEREGAGWFVAVQWHPEVTAATDPAQQALFNELVARAAG